MMTSQISYPSE